MSRLEDLTKPILLRLIRGEEATISKVIRGEEATISKAAQRQLSAWIQPKEITLDAFDDKEYGSNRHIPAFVAHKFCQAFQPLPGGVVVLGDIEPFPVGSGMPFGRRMMDAPGASA